MASRSSPSRPLALSPSRRRAARARTAQEGIRLTPAETALLDRLEREGLDAVA
ncbi:hypothetical protein [Aurantimonas sp. Leaf443]|uniref:hypothetical protein n=1 Tax=Aurantimonas sp. Leaf443 TaxID=1736378 RepID=UPI000AAB6EB5|nr:hypothetical protein [Aurantimonas sp. Leaf443]